MQMNGWVAIVTGASRGIGRAIAKAYAEQGARVVVTARPRTPTGLSSTIYQTADDIRQAGGEAMSVPCNVADEEQVRAMVQAVTKHYGRIDVLVNNAGIFYPRKPLLELAATEWDETLAVNVRGPYLTCRYVLPVMMRQRQGSIINIGSGAATIPRAGGTAYSSSKAALHMFSLCLAEEVRAYNIAVNVLNPGGVKTEGAESGGWPPAWHERVEPEAVVPSAIFLALQSAETFSGRVVLRAEFGISWP
jgi:NAD(P)-dependent dehydrogenase (short-subunit alcohol dehydrogenase family)